MLYLFDTSIWIDHFRVGHPGLQAALEQDQALTHSRVVGELAVGSIPRRQTTIDSLLLLPFAPEIQLRELLRFIERFRLYSRGLSLVDVELIASALVAEARLITLDRKLRAAWKAVILREQRRL